MRSRWTAFIIVVVSLLVIMLAVGQTFFAGGSDLSTETAYFYSMEEEIPFTGVYLRDETVVYDSGSGVLSYECDNGSRVGKSTVVARRYKSESDINARREIERLSRRIEVLKNAERLLGTDSSQLEAISSQINERHAELIDAIRNGDYTAAAGLESTMLEALCKREITLGKSEGYTARISELENRIAQLNASVQGSTHDICAGGAGYFVSGTDGYEGELGFSDIEGLTAKRINDIIAKPEKSTDSRTIGKLISDYRWRAAAVIETQRMFGMNETKQVQLRVGSDGSLFDAVIVSVTDNGDGTSLYIFECDRLNDAVTQGRTAQFKLVVSSYGGLRVSASAKRMTGDNEYGVYVVEGTSLKYRKLDVIYWGDDYVISAQNDDPDYLKLYDIIVTEGKDLYDGKVVE